MNAKRIQLLFLLDQPAMVQSLHGPAWERYRAEWEKEFRGFHQHNRALPARLQDSLADTVNVVLELAKAALLVAGALTLIHVLASDPARVMAFPLQDFWMSECLGVGLYMADRLIRRMRNRHGPIWMSALDQRARQHMSEWSRVYFMAWAGVEAKSDRGVVLVA